LDYGPVTGERQANHGLGLRSAGVRIGSVAVTGSASWKLLDEPQRLTLFGWLGSLYSVRDAVLTDGPEAE
jgi:hypothetical protein